MKLFLVLLFLFSNNSYSETTPSDQYEKPGPFDFVTDIPRSLKEGWEFSFNTKPATLWTWGGVIASSVVFYVYDEKIYKHAKILGNKLGLGNDDHTKPMITIGGTNIFRGPTDLGSTMYFIGDGWLQTSIAASFAITGAVTSDNRALQTGSQIMNSLITASIPTQVLKRATGREDPNRATKYRGRWRPFSPNYSKDVSAYDAVPSGHLMAATSTLTVIDSNYPEYRSVIRPVGFTLLTLLSFQMVNIGVHWVSDYPLGLAFGYVFGKVASTHGKTNQEKEPDITSLSDWRFLPLYTSDENGRAMGGVALFDF
ncbi:phosphatase PAP2 family protein [Bacteriovorax sp. PP10]|uniref:Phosphatase PAP2 family protein n=1 Tax=Bacteriovorax antarcticus TaxID=3088717 RepID=A0ABU5VV76_9BACT|nr:phosphatase PAP2 family protein [Bacteriovorax sp. PP10]MEA9356264.1 phosphatase PAP2 family protein [Bacteriovorax sp. PP10]